MIQAAGRFARSVWGLPTAVATTVSMVAVLSGYPSLWQHPHQLPAADVVATRLGSPEHPLRPADLDPGSQVHFELVPRDGQPIDYAGAEFLWSLLRNGEVLRTWQGDSPTLTFDACELDAGEGLTGGRYAVAVTVYKQVRRRLRDHRIRVQGGSTQLHVAGASTPGQALATPAFEDPAAVLLDLTPTPPPSASAASSSLQAEGSPPSASPAAREPAVGLEERLEATSTPPR
ncbi:MAG: hypothetical protein KDD82_13455 [Planctomycetes bacterium]|nr:hypothetical protein [Planctomycetota bacterium]